MNARVGSIGDGLLQGGDGVRFVVFNAEVDGVGTKDVGGDLRAADDGGGMFADLHVIAGDIGFAFGGVDDEGAGGVFEFARGGEAGAAQSADAAFVDAGEQFGGAALEVIMPGGQGGGGAVFAVGCNHHGGRGGLAGVDVGVFADGKDGAGGGGVAGDGAGAVFAGDDLSAQDVFAHGDGGGLQEAVALAQGEDVVRQDGQGVAGLLCGLRFVAGDG